VVPEFAPEGVVCLVEDQVRGPTEQEEVRAALRDVVLQPVGQIVDGRRRERSPHAVRGRRWAIGQRVQAAVRLEGALAAQAVADAVVDLAVVDLVEPEPVEEEAVHGIAVDHLVERLERLLLVVLAAGADAEQPAVDLRLPARRDVEPLWVLGGDLRRDLGEIHPCHQTQSARVGPAHRIAQHVAAGALREVRVAGLERQVGGVEGEDAAGVHEPDIGAVLLDVVEDGLDVERRVDLAQIGLEHAERQAPPGWCDLGGRRRDLGIHYSSCSRRARASVLVSKRPPQYVHPDCKRYHKLFSAV
jgi:hypothetical protein